ncbi:hypothetical protein UA08_07547 [Talaromyces atroroseus]|uniref:Uncharacterized protein n=1 Tax=Talaromyces atroroseus TaxID=1441469 RepID=A0A225A914_TALAT|nr:hypothetical protein UA08_07547 [Talaromyces atroroseus]OKL57182.1 hypothetical protein UA08_07547 [Talaromyces atroroseus]
MENPFQDLRVIEWVGDGERRGTRGSFCQSQSAARLKARCIECQNVNCQWDKTSIVPELKIPTSGSADIITYTWKGIVQENLMPSRNLDKVVAPVNPDHQADPQVSTESFLNGIWEHSSTYARDFLLEDSTATKDAFDYDYTRRFTMPIWNTGLC